MSFWGSHFYRTHMPTQFNMCNGTCEAGSRERRRYGAPDAHLPGIKKIALDPAESSAIERRNLLGQVPSFEALWVSSDWGIRFMPSPGRQPGAVPREMGWCCEPQASLRCCGIPASSARTSASR
ncbi:hypothetical protein GCM10010347_38490 [Streptomyces cirratus]|uniref:Uncharacterized protein n=1 Tax=Streptomyces cirratus TaxID=68187 RepID=A0ABQ3EZH7_9ACTN|nr:hypothetical protein GCM10010347_38490 [Streptomyces cirratus]